jgi:hypothetical protein
MPKRVVVCGCLFVIAVSTMFVINQTAQVVFLASSVHPVFGRVVLWTLLVLETLAMAVPVALLVRMPKALTPPEDSHSEEYREFLRHLGARLSRNPRLTSTTITGDQRSIENALTVLDATADDIVKETASRVFVSTAISQNGRLDALMVLAEQSRLIWRVAHVYNQRPSVSEFGRLYANVGATLFAASAIEDLDISEQVEPVVKAAVGGAVASLVPGVASVSSIVMHSILDGTANAYLTLRVGIICRGYCQSITAIDRRGLRRNASVTAAAMLGSVVLASAGAVTRSMTSAARNAGAATLESATAGVRGLGTKLNPFKKQPGES